jgi:ArsR family transcriptional regulator
MLRARLGSLGHDLYLYPVYPELTARERRPDPEPRLGGDSSPIGRHRRRGRNPRGPGIGPLLVDTNHKPYYHMLMSAARTARPDRLLQRQADLLKALAQPTRLRILRLLAEGERCVCEIQPAVGGEQSNVSKHLAFLRSRGLVVADRRGMRVFYRLADRQILAVLRETERLLSRAIKTEAELVAP